MMWTHLPTTGPFPGVVGIQVAEACVRWIEHDRDRYASRACRPVYTWAID